VQLTRRHRACIESTPAIRVRNPSPSLHAEACAWTGHGSGFRFLKARDNFIACGKNPRCREMAQRGDAEWSGLRAYECRRFRRSTADPRWWCGSLLPFLREGALVGRRCTHFRMLHTMPERISTATKLTMGVRVLSGFQTSRILIKGSHVKARWFADLDTAR
jgi:hypothetical protein